MALRLALTACAMWAVVLPAQRPSAAVPSATAQISGTVVTDEESPVPLRRARVTVVSTDGRGGTTVVTDDAGQFIAGSLLPGRYTVTASRAGFVRSVLGARQPGGSGVPVAVAEGERSSGHVIRVARGAVITGVLRDRNGRELPGVAVTLSRFGYKDGHKVRLPDASTGVTDDQGVYRIYGLRPGEYFVSTAARRSSDDVPIVPTRQEDVARARALLNVPGRSTSQSALPSSAALGQVMTYYPGVTSPDLAVPIRLGKAEERRGVDFTVTLQPIVSISATVLMPDGRPATTTFRSIARREGADTTPTDDPVMIANRPPKLTVSQLLPGSYTVSVEAPEPGTTRPAVYWAQATIRVADQDVDGVILQLNPSMMVSGRLVYEGMPEPDRPKTEVPITLTEALVSRHINSPNGKSKADGSFVVTGVSPRRYRIDVRPDEGWLVKSILRSTAGSDIDHADVPLVIEPGVSPSDLVVTLTRNTTRLSGMLTDEQGRAATDFHVVVFSTDQRYWAPRSRRIQAIRPDSDGKFSVTGLPEGDYLIAALTDLEDGEWFDRQFLASIASSAIKVKVSEAAPTVQAIRIAR